MLIATASLFKFLVEYASKANPRNPEKAPFVWHTGLVSLPGKTDAKKHHRFKPSLQHLGLKSVVIKAPYRTTTHRLRRSIGLALQNTSPEAPCYKFRRLFSVRILPLGSVDTRTRACGLMRAEPAESDASQV